MLSEDRYGHLPQARKRRWEGKPAGQTIVRRMRAAAPRVDIETAVELAVEMLRNKPLTKEQGEIIVNCLCVQAA